MKRQALDTLKAAIEANTERKSLDDLKKQGKVVDSGWSDCSFTVTKYNIEYTVRNVSIPAGIKNPSA